MKTSGQGGCFARIMPPDDWDYGPIPQECYDKALTVSQINELLQTSYYTPERIKLLAESDDPLAILQAKMAIEIIIGIDAETIYKHNQYNHHNGLADAESKQ